VTGAANVVSTTTATAVNVANTTIGAANVTFQSVSASGAPTAGIILNNTGVSGSLVVTGTGVTAGSGGTVQNCVQRGGQFTSTQGLSLSNMSFSGNGTANLATAAICGDDANGTNTNCAAGIDLQNVTTVSLTRVTVTGGAQIGINGKTVSGLTLNTVTVSGAGNEALEDGVQLTELTGTNTFTSVNFNNNASRQLAVQNGSGTGTLNITSSSFTNTAYPTLATTPSSGTAAQGILYSGHGNANMTLNIQNSTFARNFAAAVFSDTQGRR
jgi:hypothetical protein